MVAIKRTNLFKIDEEEEVWGEFAEPSQPEEAPPAPTQDEPGPEDDEDDQEGLMFDPSTRLFVRDPHASYSPGSIGAMRKKYKPIQDMICLAVLLLLAMPFILIGMWLVSTAKHEWAMKHQDPAPMTTINIGRYAYHFYKERRTWQDASGICSRSNGQLVQFNSSGEFEKFSKFVDDKIRPKLERYPGAGIQLWTGMGAQLDGRKRIELGQVNGHPRADLPMQMRRFLRNASDDLLCHAHDELERSRLRRDLAASTAKTNHFVSVDYRPNDPSPGCFQVRIRQAYHTASLHFVCKMLKMN